MLFGFTQWLSDVREPAAKRGRPALTLRWPGPAAGAAQGRPPAAQAGEGGRGVPNYSVLKRKQLRKASGLEST